MKKTLCILVASVLLGACGTLSPRDRYIKALDYKLEGDAQAYQNELFALALEEPNTRAGRRARATLSGGGLMVPIAAVGVLAAIAIPNFLKFQGRARQSEAKIQLKAIFTCLKAYYAESGRYPTKFSQCGYRPEPGARYLYFLSLNEVVGGDGAADPALLRLRAQSTLAAMNIQPTVEKESFLAVAVGDPDNDGQLDIWAIDERNNLVHLLNDD